LAQAAQSSDDQLSADRILKFLEKSQPAFAAATEHALDAGTVDGSPISHSDVAPPLAS
jgi:hypothetical protein